jgi:hypothetical protein
MNVMLDGDFVFDILIVQNLCSVAALFQKTKNEHLYDESCVTGCSTVNFNLKAYRLLDICKFCPQNVPFCIDLRTKSDYSPIYSKLNFYNRDGMCLLCGSN